MHFKRKNRRFVENRRSIRKLAKLLRFYSKKGRGSTHNIRSWLVLTSYPYIGGKRNTEYKKLMNLIDYLLLPSNGKNRYSHLDSAIYQVLITDYDALEAYINEMLAFLNVVRK